MGKRTKTQSNSIPVAIIGIGCLFPRARDVKEFWRLVYRGEDGITDVPESHWSVGDYFNENPKFPDHTYCKKGGFIPKISYDPAEFGIPPNTLEATDTSQLFGLLVAKQALEDAGYGKGRKFNREKTSVILGATGTQELVIPLGARLGHPAWRKALLESGLSPEKTAEVMERIAASYVPWQENSFPGLLGNVIAGRIANRLDLGGTNCVVDAACASSLSALNMALMELCSGRCDMALSGGVDTLNDIFMHMCFSQTGVLSHTSDAKPFSASADGTVLGEGVGIMVLKRLEDAEKDHDRIYAVIKAIGSSSDGRSQSIYAPNALGQTRALRIAYDNAGFETSTVELLEAHGTGTRVGDAVEFSAAKKVFQESGVRDRRCALGSVKSNIGHTKAGAGAAGMIKAALCLHHKVKAPTLKVDKPDPGLKIEDSPFYLISESKPWVGSKQHPRRSGVSAFGFGGSNFHVVLEEYKGAKTKVSWDQMVEITAFSSADEGRLFEDAKKFISFFRQARNFKEIVLRAWETRQSFSPEDEFRLLFAFEKPFEETMESFGKLGAIFEKDLTAIEEKKASASRSQNVFFGKGKPKGGLGFLFPGQGSQYTGMGRDLVCCFPESIDIMESADTIFRKTHESEPYLSDIIFPEFQPGEDKKVFDEKLKSTHAAQPAIGAISQVMVKILERFGIRPDAVAGHSFGELTALKSAGWIDGDTFISLAVRRGELMADAGNNMGSMLAVRAPLADIDKMIEENKLNLVLANRNSPNQGVLSGEDKAIEEAVKICREKGFRTTLLPVSCAFHSKMMDNAAKPFAISLKKMKLTPSSSIKVFSNTTGSSYPLDKDKALDILENHILNPVNFVEEIENMYNSGIGTFVEVGPKTVLCGLAKSILKGKDATIIPLDASAGRQPSLSDLARALCRLAAEGRGVALKDWEDQAIPPRKQMMSIMMNGANIQHKKKEIPPSKPEPAAVEKKIKPAGPREIAMPSPEKTISAPPPKKRLNVNTEQMPQAPAGTGFITDALKVVSESLRSMQAIQARTSETHKKFLETQTEATRSLQGMMERTRNMTEAAMGISPLHYPEAAALNNAPMGIPDTPRQEPLTEPLPLEKPQPMETLAKEKSQELEPVEKKHEIPDAVGKLMKVVSKLTGYPTEMLELSMDIESDLGIDSIKRVEILSTLEEEIPDLPSFSPEIMASLKTLGEVADYLLEQLSSSREESLEEGTQTKNDDKVKQALLEVVSQLTGYPVEMLSPEMDIESDLGIDSIKRVEILSTFEEKMPGLKQVSTEVMGSLKTLGEIIEYMSDSDSPEGKGAEQIKAAGGEIEKTLLEVVSQLTGYPVEMLSPEMDIESDLGIDSIKRVEILSTFEEKMPGLKQVSTEVMGSLKTLGEIIEYMSDSDSPEGKGAQEIKAVGGEIEKTLLEVVSQLTGYPVEMLSPEMDIESDLGIDSIKRVEILSTFEEKMPALPSISAEAMGELKTLGQIIDYLSSQGQDGEKEPKAQEALPSLEVAYKYPSDSREEYSPDMAQVARRKVIFEEKPIESSKQLKLAKGRVVYVVDDKTGLGRAIASAMESEKIQAGLVSPLVFQDDKNIRENMPNAGGIVIIPDVDLLTDRFNKKTVWDEEDEKFLKQSFRIANVLGPDIIESAKQGGGLFVSITRLDGMFGFNGEGVVHPLHGGLAGLVKTAALEWEGVSCHALDISPLLKDNEIIAGKSVSEIMGGGFLEAGLNEAGWFVPRLVEENPPEGKIKLGRKDVAVITGGARGVTAACGYALAKHVKPSIAMLGRSPLPEKEPEWLIMLKNEAEIKKAILENEFKGRKVAPVAINQAYKKYMGSREIVKNLNRLKNTGAKVRYYQVDVRDYPQIEEAARQIRDEMGEIKCLIHGAGVLEDKLILEKTSSQFEKVFDTKAKGLKNMLKALKEDDLHYMVFFSSVSGRMGNKGQVDYAMANEVMNKIAQQEKVLRKDCRTVAINWGPWDGGMVSPSLKREFQRQNIGLIPIEAGAMSMLYEMMGDSSEPAEIVLGATITDPVALFNPDSGSREKKETLTQSFEEKIGLDRYPFLDSHVIGGKAVVPFAMMAEWFGHGALCVKPALNFCGIDDMRLMAGIKIDEGAKLISMLTHEPEKNGDYIQVRSEIRNGTKEKAGRAHARATVLMGERLPPPPKAFSMESISGNSYPLSIEEAYEKVLFHGGKLHGIKELTGFSEKGIAARVIPAPSPGKWLTDPYRDSWILDPLVIDSVFQLAILWTHEIKGMVSLPSYLSKYRQYLKRFPSDGVIATLEVRECSEHKMTCDIMIIDNKENPVASLEGYEAVMDPSLMKAFK